MATFFNSATLSYNGNVTNSNVVTGELVEVLAATKTAVREDYTTGQRVTYVVSLVNSGGTNVTDLTITDDLGGYEFGTPATTLTPLTYVDGSILYYSNGVLQGAPTVTAGPPITITGITVPANGNVTLVYEATANQYAPLASGATINNTVTITGGGITNPIVADATITAASEPSLTISKSLSPSTVAENGQLTYTFLIQNNGNAPATAADNLVLTDTFNPILSNLTVTYNGTPWAPTANYTYNPATGVFATVAGQMTVPAATYTQDPTTGVWSVTPGVSTLVVTGTV